MIFCETTFQNILIQLIRNFKLNVYINKMKHVKIIAIIALAVIALAWYYRNNIESFMGRRPRRRPGRPNKPKRKLQVFGRKLGIPRPPPVNRLKRWGWR